MGWTNDRTKRILARCTKIFEKKSIVPKYASVAYALTKQTSCKTLFGNDVLRELHQVLHVLEC